MVSANSGVLLVLALGCSILVSGLDEAEGETHPTMLSYLPAPSRALPSSKTRNPLTLNSETHAKVLRPRH